MLLVVGNLKTNKDAIVDLIGNNYEIIISRILDMSNKDRRIGLLKVFINLILEASEHLSNNTELFKRIYEFIGDSRVDEYMVENILWFSTSLCEQRLFNCNFHMVLDQMIQNNICRIICISLDSKQERIILQALKLLTNLADEELFREQMYLDSQIFDHIQMISK